MVFVGAVAPGYIERLLDGYIMQCLTNCKSSIVATLCGMDCAPNVYDVDIVWFDVPHPRPRYFPSQLSAKSLAGTTVSSLALPALSNSGVPSP